MKLLTRAPEHTDLGAYARSGAASAQAWLVAIMLVFAAAFATSAHAQMARYCEGKLAANAFYQNVQSNGSRSTADYFLQIQNQSNEPMRYAVRFVAPHIVHAQNGSVVANLAAYQQVTVKLGSQNFNNPAGTGSLSQADLMRYTQIVCPK